VDRDGDVGRRVVSATGDVDLETAPKLWEQLMDALSGSDGDVVADLGAVTFLDSTGIVVLIKANNRLVEDGRRLILRNPHQNVRRALDICAVPTFIAIEDA
jgi:anti-anti-sigma factor